jgi:hypothetical protein
MENRDTYLPESRILDRVIATSDKISRFLATMRQQANDERSRLHIDNLIDLQSELTASIADYRRQAPWQVTNTYVQYVDPGSGKVDDMIEEFGKFISTNDVTAAAIALDQEMIRELEPVSINEGVQESQEAFDNLQTLIKNTCRKIAMDDVTARDV